jgi:hypothetical protein
LVAPLAASASSERLIYVAQFMNEFEMLGLQVQEHLPTSSSATVVSVMVVVESNMTHSGTPKPLHLTNALRERRAAAAAAETDEVRGGGNGVDTQNEADPARDALLDNLLRLAQFGRFVVVAINDMHLTPMPSNDLPGDIPGERRDVYQRDMGVYRALAAVEATHSDVVAVVDIDTVISGEAVAYIWQCRETIRFPVVPVLAQFVYNVGWRTSWDLGDSNPSLSGDHVFVSRAGLLLTGKHSRTEYTVSGATAIGRSPYKMAPELSHTIVRDGGWHFTWFGGVEGVSRKLRNMGNAIFNIYSSGAALGLPTEFIDGVVLRMITRGDTLWGKDLISATSAKGGRGGFHMPRAVVKLREQQRTKPILADTASLSKRLAFWFGPKAEIDPWTAARGHPEAFLEQQDQQWLHYLVQVAAATMRGAEPVGFVWYDSDSRHRRTGWQQHERTITVRCDAQYLALDTQHQCQKYDGNTGTLTSLLATVAELCNNNQLPATVTVTVMMAAGQYLPVRVDKLQYIVLVTRREMVDADVQAFCQTLKMDKAMCAQLKEACHNLFC